jgi:pimeloyl-ACP methyl ester carboxylesterase
MVDVGGGAVVYVECSGTGSPTVVFESGDESDISQWRAVLPGVVATTRACAYDRLGLRSSSPALGCRGATDLRRVLEAALRGAGAHPPYVLVGTSGGGYLVTNYALAHRDQVRGLVIVDTFPAIDLAKAPPELRREIRCDSPTNRERRDYAAVEHAAWDHRVGLGDSVWVTVISNDYGTAATDAEERSSVASQRGWFVLNPKRARQVVVDTGHDIPGNEPATVVDEIVRVVAAVRSS